MNIYDACCWIAIIVGVLFILFGTNRDKTNILIVFIGLVIILSGGIAGAILCGEAKIISTEIPRSQYDISKTQSGVVFTYHDKAIISRDFQDYIDPEKTKLIQRDHYDYRGKLIFSHLALKHD